MTEKTENNIGRPTVVTAEVLRKLEEAFTWGCSNREACLYADIGETTFYEYRAANSDFAKRIEVLRDSPKLKARAIINKKLNELDGDTAKWYLERKAKDEFSTKTENTNINNNVEIDYQSLNKEKLIEINKLLDEII